MIVDIRIQVANEKITVESKQKEYRVNLKNSLGSISSGMVVAIGQSLDDLIRENPHNADKFKEEVKFEQLYTPTAKGLENIQFLLAYQAMQLSKKKNLLGRLFGSDSLICNLELPGYEQIDADVRKQFEYSMTKSAVRELTINAIPVGWEGWQRSLLAFTRSLMPLLVVLVWYGFLVMTSQYIYSLHLIWIFLIWVLSLAACYYLMAFLRILLLRQFLPQDLLISELKDRSDIFGKLEFHLFSGLFKR
jgi:hypothetical protein